MANETVLLRQQRLLERSMQLRTSISDQSDILIGPLAIADKVRSSADWLYCNPQWPVALIFVFFTLKPRKAVVWGSRLWGVWKTYKRFKGLIEKAPSSRIPI